jgi:hypothetical protein
MKRIYLISALLLALMLLFNTCGRKKTVETGDGAVIMLCDCFLEAGIENEYDLMDLEYDEKKSKEVIKCILPILKDVRSELDDMEDDARADYFGNAIKAAVDCECGTKLLDIAAKLYDTKDGEEGFDELIQTIEWIGGYYGSNFLFGGTSSYDYWEEEPYYDYDYYDDYEYEEPYPEYEEECYGDYYSMEIDLVDLFMYNIAYGNIVLGETTWSEMDDYTGYGGGFDTDYDGMYVSGYFEYDEDDVIQYISLDYYYECEGVMEYVDMDQESITSAIDYALDVEGEYSDYDDDITWKYDDMTITQTNYSDGFAIYIEYDDY